jgi:hypothetical protein
MHSDRAEAVADTLDLIPMVYRQATTKHMRKSIEASAAAPAAALDGDGDTNGCASADPASSPAPGASADPASSPAPPPPNVTFTADTMLPIFLYIVVQAAIPDLLVVRHEMQLSRHSGRADYALVTLDAAVEAILAM